MSEPRRPLIELPSWDGKLVLAGIFILGYYGLVFVLVVGTRDLTGAKSDIVRDAMLTLGPPIGVIVGALFRNTNADERRDVLRSRELTSALAAPPLGLPAPQVLSDAVADGTKAGLERAEPLKTQPVEPLAADGVRREWLDEPATDESLPEYAR